MFFKCYELVNINARSSRGVECGVECGGFPVRTDDSKTNLPTTSRWSSYKSNIMFRTELPKQITFMTVKRCFVRYKLFIGFTKLFWIKETSNTERDCPVS